MPKSFLSVLASILLLAVGTGLKAQPYAMPTVKGIAVSVFEREKPRSLVLKPQDASFSVYSGEKKVASLKKNETLFLTIAKGGGMRVRTIARALGMLKNVSVRGATDSSQFVLQSVTPNVGGRLYAGRIDFSVRNGILKSVLTTPFDLYVAGVVAAEIGTKQVLEMDKVQAIIARTYALQNLDKHKNDGFNLCDNVHCQAFKGIVPNMSLITEACNATRDLVVVDQDNEMITAVFHANCGGQTANSEDVWEKRKEYLRSVKCPYCSNSKNYRWSKGVAADDWFAFAHVCEPHADVPLAYSQTEREATIRIGAVDVSLKKVREALGLRSAYFSFSKVGDSVVFEGKGYGHGVGLCQDGASSMARLNMSYEQIISYYYTGCKVVNIHNALPEEPKDDFFDDYASENYGSTVVAEKKEEPAQPTPHIN